MATIMRPVTLETNLPPTPKGRQTRDRILEAAARVFGRDGFVNARMSDIAAEAALSMGGLYRYYGNKEAVFESLVAELHESLYNATRATVDFVSSPYDALLEANRGWLQVYYDNRHTMRAFIEATNVDDRFRRQWWQNRDRHVARFVHVLNARSTGRRETPDPELMTEALAGMTEQAAFIWFAHQRTDNRPVSVDEAASVVATAWYRTFFE